MPTFTPVLPKASSASTSITCKCYSLYLGGRPFFIFSRFVHFYSFSKTQIKFCLLNNYHIQQSYLPPPLCYLCNLDILLLLHLSLYINGLFICLNPSVDCELPEKKLSHLCIPRTTTGERRCSINVLCILKAYFQVSSPLYQGRILQTFPHRQQERNKH